MGFLFFSMSPYSWSRIIFFNSSPADFFNFKYVGNLGNIDNIGDIPVRAIGFAMYLLSERVIEISGAK